MINNLGNKIYLSAYIYVNDYLISFKIPYHISPHSNLLKVIVFSSSVGFFQIHNQAKILNLNLMVHLQDIERPASIPQPASIPETALIPQPALIPSPASIPQPASIPSSASIPKPALIP